MNNKITIEFKWSIDASCQKFRAKKHERWRYSSCKGKLATLTLFICRALASTSPLKYLAIPAWLIDTE